ncbi:MAG: aromatic hydrocarbon degradation protein [Ginsengibacter sp.]
MKAIYLTLVSFFLATITFAQEPADALRYSFTHNPGGTARNQAIGGAGASLGGEFTSLFINPAGIGFYKTGDLVFTPSISLINGQSKYLNSSANSKNSQFNLNTSGVLFASPSQNKNVRNVTIGIGVNRAADFNNRIYYKGENKKSSYADTYIDQLLKSGNKDANEAALNFPYGPSLAINTYLVDPVFGTNGELEGYSSVADPSMGLLQENTITTTGGITDVSLGVGVNVQDKWFFGGSLSVPFLYYNRDGNYKESDASKKPDNHFNFFEVNERLESKGVGIGGKLGIIFKPVEFVRLGAAIHTPTFFQITDNYVTQVVADVEDGQGVRQMSSTDLSSTNYEPLVSKYNLSTPWKFMVSGSYVFREVQDVTMQKGFITADIEYVNYKNPSFGSVENDQDAKNYYKSLNKTIDNIYKDAVNVRLGGEVKFNTWMARLGGAYYGNPYKYEKANLIKVSGGLGYRHKGFFIDLTYVHSLNKDVHYPYRLDPDFPENASRMIMPAALKNNDGNIVLSFGFKI